MWNFRQAATGHLFNLIPLPLDKMAAMSTDDTFKCILLNVDYKIQIQFSPKLVSRSQIDDAPALVEVMAWRRIGDTPLPEPMLTYFNDAYMRHSGWMSD